MTHLRRRPTRRPSAERGQSLVEFSMVITVMMLLLLGMLEFGFIFDQHLTLEYSSREGARVGAALANGSHRPYPCAQVRQQRHRRGPARHHLARLAGDAEPRQRDPHLQVDLDGRPVRARSPTRGSTRRPAGPVVDGKALDFKNVDHQLVRLRPEQHDQRTGLDRRARHLLLPARHAAVVPS